MLRVDVFWKVVSICLCVCVVWIGNRSSRRGETREGLCVVVDPVDEDGVINHRSASSSNTPAARLLVREHSGFGRKTSIELDR